MSKKKYTNRNFSNAEVTENVETAETVETENIEMVNPVKPVEYEIDTNCEPVTDADEIVVEENPSYTVKVSINALNIRKGPGMNYDKTGKYTGIGIFTIVETCNGEGSETGWGRLESGDGWICLDFTERV